MECPLNLTARSAIFSGRPVKIAARAGNFAERREFADSAEKSLAADVFALKTDQQWL
jgi:hypothetical protein